MAKVTKRERFEQVIAVLETIEGTEELVAFAEREKEILAKRAGKERKPTATQVANEAVKAEILEVLAEAGAEGVTATEVGTALELSTQKVSALVRQLVLSGQAERVEGKGKTKTIFKVVG